MKRFITTAILGIALFAMSSCSTSKGPDFENAYEPSNLTAEQIKFYNECPQLHSEGLEYFYNLAVEPDSKLRALSLADDPEVTDQYVKSVVVDFCSQRHVRETLDSQSLGVSSLRSASDDIYTDEAEERVCALLEQFSLNCNHEKLLESIDVFMASNEVQELTQYEQDVLFVGLSIYEDSYNYWIEPGNRDKWEKLQGDMPLPETRGNLWGKVKHAAESAWMAAKPYVMADAKGAVAGGISGGIVGAATGAGIVASAGAGALGGAVYESISEAL